MLKEIADLSENASLTGSLSGGASHTARRFNSCLRQLRTMGAVPDGMFDEIPEETAQFAQIGVDARLLASYIRDQGHENDEGRRRHKHEDANILVRLAPFVRGEDLAKMIRQKLADGLSVDEHTLVSLAPFMPGELLSELVQASLAKHSAPAAPREPEAPTPSAPAPSATTTLAVPVEESREELIERISQPGLSHHERHELALRIAELS